LALTCQIGLPASSNCSKTKPKKVNLVFSSGGVEAPFLDGVDDGLLQEYKQIPKQNIKGRQNKLVGILKPENE
jgi:hypothetical protein